MNNKQQEQKDQDKNVSVNNCEDNNAEQQNERVVQQKKQVQQNTKQLVGCGEQVRLQIIDTNNNNEEKEVQIKNIDQIKIMQNNQINAQENKAEEGFKFQPFQLSRINPRNKSSTPQKQIKSQKNQQSRQNLLDQPKTKLIKKQSTPVKSTNQSKYQYKDFDLISGQQILVNQDSTLIQQKLSIKQDGKIIFTNYRILFLTVIQKKKMIDIPIGYIHRLQRNVNESSRTVIFSTIDMTLKYGIIYKFKFNIIQFSDKIFKIMGKFVYCGILQVFAFSYAKSKKSIKNNLKQLNQIAIKNNGWKFNWKKQYIRMGIDFQNNKTKQSVFQIINNQQLKYCLSYPEFFIVPAQANHDLLNKCSKTRSKQKLPILSYAFPISDPKQQKFSCLWRASHLKLYNNNLRNIADQQYIRILGSINQNQDSNQKNLIIYDIKPKSSLMNTTTKTYLPIQFYKNAILRSLQLQTLSVIRESYNKLLLLCFGNQSIKWLKYLQQSKWLQQVSLFLKEACNIANAIQAQTHVLIQFNESIERSAQLCALVQIIIDPYYRTFQGFEQLIQKQFNWLGYPFSLRLGIKKQRQDERSPTFIQFLDCVYQLIQQYPLSFQYTSKYLARIAYQLYTNKYGNFLCGNRKQIKQDYKIEFSSISLWGELIAQQNRLYTNPYFVGPKQSDIYDLRPLTSTKAMIFWKDHFFRLTTALKESYSNGFLGVQQNRDYINILHRQIKTETQELRKMVSSQYTYISQLKSELYQLQLN